jgi:hypothetical protein
MRISQVGFSSLPTTRWFYRALVVASDCNEFMFFANVGRPRVNAADLFDNLSVLQVILVLGHH